MYILNRERKKRAYWITGALQKKKKKHSKNVHCIRFKTPQETEKKKINKTNTIHYEKKKSVGS